MEARSQQEHGQGDAADETQLDSQIPAKDAREDAPPSPASLLSSDSDSDEESPVADFTYEIDEEWQDVTPVPLAVGSVMPIAFASSFQSVFGYFRALLARGELSPRGLRLSEDAVRLNSANYAVWMYRRKVLAHLGSDLISELQYISRVIEKNPKNYQVWYHRQKIVELLKDPSKEFQFTARMLKKDAKNYHAWQYRQFVLRHFDILDQQELGFCSDLIKTDAFNNSAWMHRYFVLDELPRACGRKSLLEGPVLSKEIQYTFSILTEQIHNESPWSYLRGILRDHWADHFSSVQVFCMDLYSQNFRSPFLLGFMVDMLVEDITDGHCSTSTAEKNTQLKQSLAICSELATKYDVIRKAYWTWLAQQLQNRFAQFV